MLVGLVVAIAKHGEPKGTTYDFGTTLVADALILGLLYWGGFFG